MWIKILSFAIICILPVWGRPQTELTNEPQHSHTDSTGPPIAILSQSESVGGDGSFNFSYETSNGIHVQEGGYIKKSQSGSQLKSDNSTGDEDVQVITGEFSYTAPDGTQISLKYIADENGFQPQGAHLPTAPPIPPQILKAQGLLQKTEKQRSIDNNFYGFNEEQDLINPPIDALNVREHRDH